MDALVVESTGTAAHQLQGQRGNPGQAGELICRNPRQSAEKRWREVVLDVAQRREDDVEIVEEPFRCRR